MATSAETEVRQQLTPMLALHDCAAAIEFYKTAFGAVEVGERYPWNGKIGHAEIRIGDALVMLADESPGHNQSPGQLGGTAVTLGLQVEDVDAATNRAVAAGAELIRSPEDQPYGRVSKFKDPYGHVWMLNGPVVG
jgi:PhnB protein